MRGGLWISVAECVIEEYLGLETQCDGMKWERVNE